MKRVEQRRDSFFLFSRVARVRICTLGRAETFTADCAPAEGHNACIKPLASHLIEMRGSFDRGAAIARIQSVIEKTRVGPFLFSFRLGPESNSPSREVVR